MKSYIKQYVTGPIGANRGACFGPQSLPSQEYLYMSDTYKTPEESSHG